MLLKTQITIWKLINNPLTSIPIWGYMVKLGSRVHEILLLHTRRSQRICRMWTAARTPPSTRAGGQDDGS